ncbi:hypothetical protein BDV23DRAFT_3286 [Aspergillus alliaceus]|uniref:Uncharacterized protein n=1 Tax=Petromyces alliaceus TaxID=209559 RepID=A0A5N7CRB9_PETAA|nr:hypothetical protein BDV23DRAFT_3286 [Aspergillus alliaceus]
MQMRNSEESSPKQSNPLSLSSHRKSEPVLPARAWCENPTQLRPGRTSAIGIRNIGAGMGTFTRSLQVFPLGESLRRLCVRETVRHFSAIRSMLVSSLPFGEGGRTVSFDSDYSGWGGASFPIFSGKSLLLDWKGCWCPLADL